MARARRFWTCEIQAFPGNRMMAAAQFSATGIRVVAELPAGTFTFAGIGGVASVTWPIVTVPGRKYILSYTGATLAVAVGVGSTSGDTSILSVNGVLGANSISFTATDIVTYVGMSSNGVLAAIVSNVSLTEDPNQ